MRKALRMLPVILLFLALIAGCAKHAPPAPIPVVTPPPQAVKADPAKTVGATDASVFFLNNQLGWAAVNLGLQQPPASLILHTSNGGQSWVQLNSPGLSSIRQVAFTDALHGWALVTAASGSDATQVGIMATIDGGQTWTQQWSGNFQQGNRPCQMQFLDANTGFALVGATFVNTTNGGATWSQLPMAQGMDSFSFSSPLVGWATGANSVWNTTNAGTKWTRQWTVPAKVKDQYVDSAGLVSMVSPDSGWALFQGDGSMFKTAKLVLHTDDGGVNWSVGSAFPSGGQDNLAVNGAPAYTMACFAPLSATTALLAASPPTDYPVLCSTTDKGNNWTTISDGMSGSLGLPKGNWGYLSFISSTEGWGVVITQNPVQPGSNDTVNNVALLHTVDGGKAWISQFP